MNKTSAILLTIIAALLVAGSLIGGYFWGRGNRPEVQRDTLTRVVTVRDTITQYKPEYITKEVIRKELVAITDTVTIHDTTYIVLPFERKEYSDSNYFAVVTGFRPELETISVYPKTQYITQTVTQTVHEKPKRWSVGVSTGFGVVYGFSGKRIDAGPYIGIGINYGIFRF